MSVHHKPQATAMVQLSCTTQSRRALFGHVWCTWLPDHGAALLPTAKTNQNLHMHISLKSRERFSWERRSHSYRCELFSLVVATCIETIADAEQQLNKTVVSSRLLLGVECLLFSLQCWVPGSDLVAATPPGKIALLNSIIEKKR